MFTYSKLYGQLKQNRDYQDSDVKLGLFFIDTQTGSTCRINKAWMEKEAHYEELIIPSSQELPLPIDANLRSANPLVFIQLPSSPTCSYSFVVMRKSPWVEKVSLNDVQVLLPQMQSLLNDLGGLFSRWFTPTITGVTLEFSPSTHSTLRFADGTEKAINNHKVQITIEELQRHGSLALHAPTRRVLPYIPK
ncbi:DUF2987 domain-containing protein [Vibrio sp. SM6]|uniref:DUF2987 domain-containing protein n=1 Tax=Vibrio agarilyticus TaxID=2726741 RepID=A0A7X8YG47_9VIBR|nr:DUF2987 domain-containing protein [Vibrio agarilyticus]